jgi:hypothetical protein
MFFSLKIKKTFPELKLKFPKKRFFGDNFDKRFLESRLIGLNEYLFEALSHPNVMKMYFFYF